MSKRNELKAVVAERGQVTIPKAVRDGLGIRPGAVLIFELKDRRIIVTKELGQDPVAAAYGCLKAHTQYSSTDEYIREIRGDAD